MPLVKKLVLAYAGEIKIISQEVDSKDDSKEHGTEVKLLLKSEHSFFYKE